MGRKKTIDRERVLQAAEAVVARDGAANLTIEAVALKAGISKAAVLYDYKTKEALIKAVVDRAMRIDDAFNDDVTARLKGQRSRAIRGRIVAASTPPPEKFRAVALNLCAALAQDANLRTTMQAHQTVVVDKILTCSSSPRGALLAYLALEGLKLLEHLDFHSFAPRERSRILREINWLVDAKPRQDKTLPKPDAVPTTIPS